MTECDCDFCKIQRALKHIMDEMDELPEIGSAFYDDPVIEIYNALDDCVHLYVHDDYSEAETP